MVLFCLLLSRVRREFGSVVIEERGNAFGGGRLLTCSTFRFGRWYRGLPGMRKLVFVALLTALTCGPSRAQENPTALSPSEAYKAALAPLKAARAQPDDLTDADKFALAIGMAQASRDCLTLSSKTSALDANEKELIALGELCIFGQAYEPARATLVKYLSLPQPPEKKLAMVLLVRALLGLNEPAPAERVVRSLQHDFPYDAQIHFAIDQVIDAAEGLNDWFDNLALQLCTSQNAVTLPLLASGKALEGDEVAASSSVLFNDALRCVSLAKGRDEPSAQAALHQLTEIAQMPNWQGTADYLPMQAGLEREKMVGGRVPLRSLHGLSLTNSSLLPRTLLLSHGTVVLLPFTVWSPSAADEASHLAKLAPQQTIYAITSWSANTGRDDAPSDQILTTLRLWQRSLPPHVRMLVVPNAELSAFHVDSFPAGILIRDGKVHSIRVLSSAGAERMLFRPLADHASKHAE